MPKRKQKLTKSQALEIVEDQPVAYVPHRVMVEEDSSKSGAGKVNRGVVLRSADREKPGPARILSLLDSIALGVYEPTRHELEAMKIMVSFYKAGVAGAAKVTAAQQLAEAMQGLSRVLELHKDV